MPSLIPEVSDGIPIPGNQGLSREDRALRIHCFYRPYRVAIERMLQRIRARGVIPAFISIHSFTPQLAAEGRLRPWQIGLMWDKDPRIPAPLFERLRAHPENINVGDNEPYSGRHAADYTIDHHAEAAGLPHVSIETRQDLVNTEEGAEYWANILDEALCDILAEPGLIGSGMANGRVRTFLHRRHRGRIPAGGSRQPRRCDRSAARDPRQLQGGSR